MSKKVTTTATTTPAPKKAKKLIPIEDYIEDKQEELYEEGGKIAQILILWIKGYSRKDIVAAGYNRSTVYRQVGDFEKMKKAPLLSYYGHDLYEGRILRVMKAKKLSREKAVEAIAKMDIEG